MRYCALIPRNIPTNAVAAPLGIDVGRHRAMPLTGTDERFNTHPELAVVTDEDGPQWRLQRQAPPPT